MTRLDKGCDCLEVKSCEYVKPVIRGLASLATRLRSFHSIQYGCTAFKVNCISVGHASELVEDAKQLGRLHQKPEKNMRSRFKKIWLKQKLGQLSYLFQTSLGQCRAFQVFHGSYFVGQFLALFPLNGGLIGL